MLYAGSKLDKAREIFTAAVKQRPRIRLTIRQVLEQRPVLAPCCDKLGEPQQVFYDRRRHARELATRVRC
jgi:hypothetical protein